MVPVAGSSLLVKERRKANSEFSVLSFELRSREEIPETSSQWCIGINVAILMESAEVRLPKRKQCFGGGGVLVNTMPYHVSGYVSGSGVWVGARKLEGELDVGGRRIVCATGESMSRCGTSLVRTGY